MYSFAIAGLYSFIYHIPYASISLSLSATDLRTLQTLYSVYILPDSIFTTIAVAIATFFPLYITLSFIAFSKGRKTLGFVLIIGSLAYVINGITFSTRDVYIFYPYMVFIISHVFRINNTGLIKQVSTILKVFIVVSSLYMVYQVSLDRFNKYAINDISYGTVGYLSQQPYVFAETLLAQSDYYGFELRFPIVNTIFGIEEIGIKRTSQYEWSFGTFLKDFYSVSGMGSLYFISLIFFIYFLVLKRVTNRSKTARLLLLLVYSHFMIEGLFYFKMGSRAGNIYLIALTITIVVLTAVEKKKNNSKLK
jgi:hypothetical protein